MKFAKGDVVIVHSPSEKEFEGVSRPCFDTDTPLSNIRIYPYDTNFPLREGDSVVIDEIICVERTHFYRTRDKMIFINTAVCAKISPYRAWEHMNDNNISDNNIADVEIMPRDIINGYEIGV